jgi:hypothetical protein
VCAWGASLGDDKSGTGIRSPEAEIAPFGRVIDFLFSICSPRLVMVEWGELTFKIVRLETGGQEVLARTGNFMVARAAFDTSISLWPVAEIELRQGARVILKSRDD